MTKEQCEKYSKMIADKLFLSNEYRKADALLVYASYQKEVSTYDIMEEALKSGKEIYCPKVLEPGKMEFYRIHSLNDIACGYKNIPEPVDTTGLYQEDKRGGTLMIMPLVGFDSRGNRLGYGGGFYDRYLQRFPELKKVALGFECQKTDSEIPAEVTDRKPDFIISEKTIYRIC